MFTGVSCQRGYAIFFQAQIDEQLAALGSARFFVQVRIR
jgi:hypothetical protein